MTAKRGFASMTPEQRRKIASMGGKAVPAEKRSFSRDKALAVRSGQKGGKAVKAEDRTFTRDRELASQCGRKGGQAKKTPTERTDP